MSQYLRTRWSVVSTVTAVAVLLSACNKGQQTAAPAVTDAAAPAAAADAVAVVDGKSIHRSSYDDYVKSLTRGSKTAADLSPEEKNQVLDQMINMQLLATQAEKDGLANDPDTKVRLDLARTQVLADEGAQKYVKSIVPTDAELHAAYDAMPDKTEYHARHILVPTKEKALALIKKIKGGAKFEDVAKAESTDSSKAQGGDLGWFSTARMVKPFGDAVKALKKGEMTTDPVQTQYGWHIIELEDTRDESFDQLKPQLSNSIIQKKFPEYIEGLKKNAKIEKKV